MGEQQQAASDNQALSAKLCANHLATKSYVQKYQK